jgi:hypothetical protein
MGKYQLYVNIRLSQENRGGGLDITEQALIEAETFLEIAGVLGEFHKLSQRIQQERGTK